MISTRPGLQFLFIGILTFLFAPPVLAQSAAQGVQVQLSLAGAKTVYRAGEPIRLSLAFTSDREGYLLNTTTTKPASPVDEMIVSPGEGVSRWLDEYSGRNRYHPDYMATQKITATPIAVVLALNDWYRFDRPGMYTVRVKTKRVLRAGQTGNIERAVELTTNEVSFEVIKMSLAEEEQEVRRLSAQIEATRELETETALAEALSYLPGDVSTREKVRRYVSTEGRSGNYSQEIYFGLFIARNRALVIRLLEQSLRDTNTPVDYGWIHTLATLRLLHAGVRLQGHYHLVDPQAESQEQRRAREIKEGYVRELAASLHKRTGESQTRTAMTVLGNLPKDPERSAQMLIDLRKILLAKFESLHPFDQERLLSHHWDHLSDASLKPAIEHLLTAHPESYQLRGEAIKRLIELDPEAARRFVVVELQDPDSVVDFDVLASLKEETLPGADAALLEQISRHGQPKERGNFIMLRLKSLAAARYASSAIYEGLMEVYSRWGDTWGPDSRGGLLGYFTRYDETRAIPLIEQALAEMEPGQDLSFFVELTRVNYSEAVGDLLRRRLESDEPEAVGVAAYILSKRGKAADSRLIEARLERWLKEWGKRGAELDAGGRDTNSVSQAMVQVNLIMALHQGKAWKIPEEKIEKLKQGCVTSVCRQHYPSR